MTSPENGGETVAYPSYELLARDELEGFMRDHPDTVEHGLEVGDILEAADKAWAAHRENGVVEPTTIARNCFVAGYSATSMPAEEVDKYVKTGFFEIFRDFVLRHCCEATPSALSYIFYQKGFEAGTGHLDLPQLRNPRSVFGGSQRGRKGLPTKIAEIDERYL